jgi:hypothetical protein
VPERRLPEHPGGRDRRRSRLDDPRVPRCLQRAGKDPEASEDPRRGLRKPGRADRQARRWRTEFDESRFRKRNHRDHRGRPRTKG